MRANPRALECHKCGRWVENIGEDAVKVTCTYCVLLAVGWPKEKPSYKPTGRPAGWHFMKEFVDKWGNVFHKGVEQPDLKGTRPITLSKEKKKILRRTKEEILIARDKEKKAALKKAHKKQKDFLNHKFGD